MEDPWVFGAAGIYCLVQYVIDKMYVCVNVCIHMHILGKHEIHYNRILHSGNKTSWYQQSLMYNVCRWY